MLAYLATKEQFLNDAPNVSQLVYDLIIQNYGFKVSEQEKQAFRNSIDGQMFFIVRDQRFPSNCAIAVEYKINGTRNRIDFLIGGINSDGKETLLIIEIKQWSKIEESKLEDCVKIRYRSGLSDSEHPSYQASGYRTRLNNMNTYIQEHSVTIDACAFLHNCEDGEIIRGSKFTKLCEAYPVFIAGESDHLLDFIGARVTKGVGIELLKRIDAAPTVPATPLASAVGGMLKGLPEYVLLDDQKVLYESIIHASTQKSATKRVIIVQGGPGTGKSVVAINALSQLVSRRLNVQYVTANAAPREVFRQTLKGTIDRELLKLLFSSSTGFHEVEPNGFDALIVDEAHRLKERAFNEPGGTNQIRAIMAAAHTSVFFVDDSQQVTWQDVGSSDSIRSIAGEFGAEVQEFSLQSQFRCNGSDEYLDWLDDLLGVRTSAETQLSRAEYDFRVFDSPKLLHEEITERNLENNRSRMVAGYCWDWESRHDASVFDIRIPEHGYQARWNLEDYGGTFVIDPGSVTEVGCIHTCQGLELDYVGVIVGPDLKCRSGELTTHPDARASTDASLHGYKTALKSDPATARARADRIIRNTYRTLMTRGMKGCYVYFTDAETADYFKGHLA